MKMLAVIAALGLIVGNNVQAAVIDLAPVNAQAAPVAASAALRSVAATPDTRIVTPPTHLPELPEPEVFAMMLVGLVLIGYKASRNSSDKFK